MRTWTLGLRRTSKFGSLKYVEAACGTKGSISTMVSRSTFGSMDTAPAVIPAPQPMTRTERGLAAVRVVRCPSIRWSRMSRGTFEAWILPAT